MGGISFEDIVTSKPFRFSIGTKKREFTMHSALVAAQCPAFDRLVNGEFKEAQDFHADLESVDEETFILFTLYAYGDYDREIFTASLEDPKEEVGLFVENYGIEGTPADPELADPEPADPEAEGVIPTPEPVVDWDVWGTITKKNQCSTCKRPYKEVAVPTRADKLWSKFKDACPAGSRMRTDWPTRKSSAGNIFLSYARLYVFADCYGISGLVDLSLYQLGKALVNTELNGGTVEDVVDVLQYCFSEPTPSKLRSLLVLYAACKIEMLWKSVKFCELLARQGELSAALIGAMINRLD